VVTCILALRVESRSLVTHDLSVGVIVFALPPRETITHYGGTTWELARLWIDDSMPRNSESWFVGQAVRHVRKTHREAKCLVSYADPSRGHQGHIYRAASWKFDGDTAGHTDYVVNGKKYARRSHVPGGSAKHSEPSHL
jgi:hypothetical protein